MLKKESIIQTLKAYGIHATKDRGQNFLLDLSVIDKMIALANIQPGDLALEIGPGLGVLTTGLAAQGAEVFAMELDKKIIKYLNKQVLPMYENITLHDGDVLSKESYLAFNEWLCAMNGKDVAQTESSELSGSYKLIANLPYQITSKAIRKFTEQHPKPSFMVIMIQKEVAQRICAEPGKMSILSIAVQVYAKPKYEFTVQRNAYFPVPRVDSAVISLDFSKPDPDFFALTKEQQKVFFQLVKIGFSAKRKQLKKNIKNVFKTQPIDIFLEQQNLSPSVRAQELSIKQWCELVKFLNK